MGCRRRRQLVVVAHEPMSSTGDALAASTVHQGIAFTVGA
jgi:hypothetical protein